MFAGIRFIPLSRRKHGFDSRRARHLNQEISANFSSDSWIRADIARKKHRVGRWQKRRARRSGSTQSGASRSPRTAGFGATFRTWRRKSRRFRTPWSSRRWGIRSVPGIHGLRETFIGPSRFSARRGDIFTHRRGCAAFERGDARSAHSFGRDEPDQPVAAFWQIARTLLAFHVLKEGVLLGKSRSNLPEAEVVLVTGGHLSVPPEGSQAQRSWVSPSA